MNHSRDPSTDFADYIGPNIDVRGKDDVVVA